MWVCPTEKGKYRYVGEQFRIPLTCHGIVYSLLTLGGSVDRPEVSEQLSVAEVGQSGEDNNTKLTNK